MILLDPVYCKDCGWSGVLHQAIGPHQVNTLVFDVNNRRHIKKELFYYCPQCWGSDKSTKGEHKSIVSHEKIS